VIPPRDRKAARKVYTDAVATALRDPCEATERAREVAWATYLAAIYAVPDLEYVTETEEEP